jgi:hypothetical protein
VTVYVDEAIWSFGRMKMCHMMADTLDELHDFAQRLGMKREWFQNKDRFPHYDVSKGKREQAIRMGAVPVDSHTLVTWALERNEQAARQAEEVCLIRSPTRTCRR